MIYLRTRDRGASIPPFLDGFEERLGYAVRQARNEQWRYVSICKVTQPTPPADADWHAIEGGWEVCQIGEISPEALCRFRGDCVMSQVLDSRGTVWHIPVVLQPFPSEKPAIDIPFGKDWRPAPTDEQERMTACALWVREAIIDAMPDVPETGSGTMAFELEMPRAGYAMADLLCYGYHMSPEMVTSLQLVDNTLMARALTIASGTCPPTEEMADEISEAMSDAVE